MGFDPSALVLVNYTTNIKDTGEIIETTLEDEAKKSGIHDPTKKYEPRLVSMGEGWVLQGFDEALQASNVGENITVEVSPEKGFGDRDPSKVRTIPLKKLGERAAELRVGAEVEIEDKIGIVRFIGSGRAQIDFNHRLAGKTLVYQAKVTAKLDTVNEKIKALIRRRLPIDEEKVSFVIDGSKLQIEIPEQYHLLEGLQIIKRAMSGDIFKFADSINKLIFTEEFSAPEKEKKKEIKSPKKDDSIKENKPEVEPENLSAKVTDAPAENAAAKN